MPRARAFGGAVVVEELLEGEEVSLFALCDGTNALPLAPAQDFKRLLDGDRGPNTGGMGSYSPVPLARAEEAEELVERCPPARARASWPPRGAPSSASSTPA